MNDFTPESSGAQDPDRPGLTPYLTVDYALVAKMYVEGYTAALAGAQGSEIHQYFLAVMAQYQEYDDLMSMARAAGEALTVAMEERAQELQS